MRAAKECVKGLQAALKIPVTSAGKPREQQYTAVETALVAFFAPEGRRSNAAQKTAAWRALLAAAKKPSVLHPIAERLARHLPEAAFTQYIEDRAKESLAVAARRNWSTELVESYAHLATMFERRGNSKQGAVYLTMAKACQARLDNDFGAFYRALLDVLGDKMPSLFKSLLQGCIENDSKRAGPALTAIESVCRGARGARWGQLVTSCARCPELQMLLFATTCAAEREALHKYWRKPLHSDGVRTLVDLLNGTLTNTLRVQVQSTLRFLLQGHLGDVARTAGAFRVLPPGGAAAALRGLTDTEASRIVFTQFVHLHAVWDMQKVFCHDGPLRVPNRARKLLPDAVALLQRPALYVSMGKPYDTVVLGTGAPTPLAWAHLNEDWRVEPDSLRSLLNNLGTPHDLMSGQAGITPPVAHHFDGRYHYVLVAEPRVHDEVTYSSLAVSDVREAQARLAHGQWTPVSLSRHGKQDMVVAAFTPGCSDRVRIEDITLRDMYKTLKQKRAEGWHIAGGYALPEDKHRVLLTSAADAPPAPVTAPLTTWRGRLGSTRRPSPTPPPAQPTSAPVPEIFRDASVYHVQTTFDEVTSLAEVPPDAFFEHQAGACRYGYDVGELAGTLCRRAGQLIAHNRRAAAEARTLQRLADNPAKPDAERNRARQVLDDLDAHPHLKMLPLSQVWQSPRAFAPFTRDEAASLRKHPLMWPLRDLPLPEA